MGTGGLPPQHREGNGKARLEVALTTPGLEVRLAGPRNEAGRRGLCQGQGPGAEWSQGPGGGPSFPPLLGEGILKGVDLLVSTLGLILPLSYHHGNQEFPSRVPRVTDPVSMGNPQFHISSPVAITTPGITSPWALLLSTTPQPRPLRLPWQQRTVNRGTGKHRTQLRSQRGQRTSPGFHEVASQGGVGRARSTPPPT